MSKSPKSLDDWKVVRDRHDHWGMIEVEGPGIGGFLIIGFTVATDADPDEDSRMIIQQANLIAAAPKLLAALQALYDPVDGPCRAVKPGVFTVHDRARDAIREAIQL